nr:RHS repeat-associated core domain-containing protein [Streptomyces scopuliridis]
MRASYRYNSKCWDAQSGTYDMGFRDYSPGLNRFTTRDMYTGAPADMNLGVDPYTGNRYAFTGGNPTSFVELDGHLVWFAVLVPVAAVAVVAVAAVVVVAAATVAIEAAIDTIDEAIDEAMEEADDESAPAPTTQPRPGPPAG